jgi:hypothetical protein
VALRAVAIALKIPDNAAYTALVALRRLGVDVAGVERSEVRVFDDGGSVDALLARIAADETIFNPNKHRLVLLDDCGPREGEVWIAPRAGAARAIAWRLTDAQGSPANRELLDAATKRLLCNPAIDRAVTREDATDRDILFESE